MELKHWAVFFAILWLIITPFAGTFTFLSVMLFQGSAGTSLVATSVYIIVTCLRVILLGSAAIGFYSASGELNKHKFILAKIAIFLPLTIMIVINAVSFTLLKQ